jgi:hypothetical protein
VQNNDHQKTSLRRPCQMASPPPPPIVLYKIKIYYIENNTKIYALSNIANLFSGIILHNHRWASLQRQVKVKYGVRSPKFIWAPCHVNSCTHWLRLRDPATPPPLPHAFGLMYEGTIGQPR